MAPVPVLYSPFEPPFQALYPVENFFEIMGFAVIHLIMAPGAECYAFIEGEPAAASINIGRY